MRNSEDGIDAIANRQGSQIALRQLIGPEFKEAVELSVVTPDRTLACEVRCRRLALSSDTIEHSPWFNQEPQAIICPIQADTDTLTPPQLWVSTYCSGKCPHDFLERQPDMIGGFVWCE